ncbi:MAG: hypothetical protein WCL51_09175 [Bacteroidota bacterium]
MSICTISRNISTTAEGSKTCGACTNLKSDLHNTRYQPTNPFAAVKNTNVTLAHASVTSAYTSVTSAYTIVTDASTDGTPVYTSVATAHPSVTLGITDVTLGITDVTLGITDVTLGIADATLGNTNATLGIADVTEVFLSNNKAKSSENLRKKFTPNAFINLYIAIANRCLGCNTSAWTLISLPLYIYNKALVMTSKNI